MKWDNYLEVYHESYQKYIGRKSNVLQIGVQNGGSLQVARSYFINAKVFGVDINPAVCNLSLGENIDIYCFDVNDKEKFENTFENARFDVIEDDGSHLSSDVISTFEYLFQKLEPGGTYLIEDLHTSYWEGYQGGYLKKTSSIEFLKRIIDLLNVYHITENSFFENLTSQDEYFIQWVQSITFYDSVAVIKKLKKQRLDRYKLLKSGKLEPIHQFTMAE